MRKARKTAFTLELNVLSYQTLTLTVNLQFFVACRLDTTLWTGPLNVPRTVICKQLFDGIVSLRVGEEEYCVRLFHFPK